MKRYLKPIILGVCLGLVLLVVQKTFQIDGDVFMKGYWMTAPAVVVVAVLASIVYNASYQRKMYQAALLLKDRKVEAYITEMERLLKTAKGKNLRNVLRLNLAAGYVEAKQFDAAVGILEGLSKRKLGGGAVAMLCNLNLCVSYFYAKQTDKAMELYRAGKGQFESFRKSKAYGGYIAEVDILAAVHSGQYDKAERLLDTAQKNWSEARLQDAFAEIKGMLEDLRGSR